MCAIRIEELRTDRTDVRILIEIVDQSRKRIIEKLRIRIQKTDISAASFLPTLIIGSRKTGIILIGNNGGLGVLPSDGLYRPVARMVINDNNFMGGVEVLLHRSQTRYQVFMNIPGDDNNTDLRIGHWWLD